MDGYVLSGGPWHHKVWKPKASCGNARWISCSTVAPKNQLCVFVHNFCFCFSEQLQFFEPLRIEKKLLLLCECLCSSGKVILESARYFRNIKSPLLCFQGSPWVSWKQLAFHLVCFHLIESVNQTLWHNLRRECDANTTAFLILTQSYMHMLMCSESRPCDIINSLTNYKPAHCSLRCCCRSFITDVLLRRSYTFQWLFLPHFFYFTFKWPSR